MRLAGRLVMATLPVFAAVLAFLGNESSANAQYYVVRRAPESVGLNLGLDVEGTADVTPPNQSSVSGGGGVKLRIGAEFHRPFLRIIPEGGFAYDHLFVSDANGQNTVGWNMERLFVGGRIGFGEVVVPVLYGHLGYGWRGVGADNTGGLNIPGGSGFTADGGVALDFHLIRHFGFGVHAEYVTVQTSPAVPDWVAVGGHLDFRF
jgi:hypothetical protein